MNRRPEFLVASALLVAGIVIASSSCSDHGPVATEADTAVLTGPGEAALVERGKYLVEIMGCHDCHSPKQMGPNGPYLDPERILSGYPADRPLPPQPVSHEGWALLNMDLTAAVGPWGTTFAANITSDESGIGNWTEEQFERALKKGLYKGSEGSRPLLPPMPWQNYVNMSKEDVSAVFAYLKSTKPVANVVPAPIPPAGPVQ
ncbi:MAG TPA: c-type cytochrome [Flavobacteriales bacterium]|jgi:hypothetical protein|nr:c-type cytochrome [Flavobacteriales bacterium]